MKGYIVALVNRQWILYWGIVTGCGKFTNDYISQFIFHSNLFDVDIFTRGRIGYIDDNFAFSITRKSIWSGFGC